MLLHPSRALLVALCVVACGSPQSGGGGGGDGQDWRSFTGSWQGVGQQLPAGLGADTWTMLARIDDTDPGPCGTIEYPSLGCSGVWICEPRFDGDTLLVRERISAGNHTCVDGGAIRIARGTDGTLQWRWASDDITASATLTRSLDERSDMQ